MDSPGKGLARRRNGASAGPNSSWRTNSWHRSASNVSSSSTSSDILVAPGPTTSRQPSQTHQDELPSTVSDDMARRQKNVFAVVREGHSLIIRVRGREYVQRLKSAMREPTPEELASMVPIEQRIILNLRDDDDDGDNADGPNRRGTYSKEYTLKHPEIGWVHRGQGRYLPASQAPPSTSTTKAGPAP